MNKARLLHGFKKHASAFAPFFLLAGLLLIGTLPVFKPSKNLIDDNAVHVWDFRSLINKFDSYAHETRIPTKHLVVHGHRSVGSETIAFYVNASAEPSVVLANFLISIFKKRKNMACDLDFYFVHDDVQEWPIPNSFVRAALVLNISSLNTHNLCFDVYGKNGMLPNQDFFNVAVRAAKQWGFSVDVLCQNPHIVHFAQRSRLEHYFRALQTALVAPQEYHAWHTFRSHGISPLAISTEISDGLYNDFIVYRIAAVYERIVVTLSYLNQRLHRSSSVWIPLSEDEHVEYDIVQFGIIILVFSMLSTGYSIYEVEDLSLSPYVVFMWMASVIPLTGAMSLGITGFLLSSGAVSLVWSRFNWSLSWLTVNAIVLCLLVIFQPAAGILIGAGIAIQLAFLHVRCQSFLLLLLGTVVSWAVLYVLLGVLKMKTNVGSLGDIYLLYFAYPSTLWVSSRMIRSVLWRNK